ncbi:hypothetical protein [Siccirubricoccus sp. G192]|uniref:hypothetical protein n=1 Tax=Siccirubricoccus sp. G192 TaxID=2849651 RepID=UPI001C2BE20C|nr:hypothetical protein [Siccirubricoccus sp. G192]MBV1796431.1 hypothetical protein [Siccirubricoccus sp. G192]
MPFDGGWPARDGAGPQPLAATGSGLAERPAALARDLRRFLVGMAAIFGLVLAAGAMLLAQG